MRERIAAGGAKRLVSGKRKKRRPDRSVSLSAYRHVGLPLDGSKDFSSLARTKMNRCDSGP